MFVDTWTYVSKMHRTNNKCGNSSVGRARPCQGRGREFEPRFPLQTNGVLAKRLCTGLQIHVARFDSGTRLHNPQTQLANHSMPEWWNR